MIFCHFTVALLTNLGISLRRSKNSVARFWMEMNDSMAVEITENEFRIYIIKMIHEAKDKRANAGNA